MESVYRIAEENLKIIGEYAKDKEVNVCIENLPKIRTFMYSDINQLHDSLERINLPMTLDIGHAYTAGFTVEDVYFERIKHIHIHDNDGIHDSHLPLGDGVIDFKKFFDIFNKNNYDGIYIIEVNDNDSIKKSYEYMKNNF